MNYIPEQVWFILIVFSPAAGPWIIASITGGKIIWPGFIAGVLVTVGIIYFLNEIGRFNGEQRVWEGILTIIFLAPLSIVIGMVSAFACRKKFKK